MKTSTSDYYYDALVDSYLNTILESGLLLDEDLQIVFNYYKPTNQATYPKYKPSFAIKLSMSTLLGSLFLIRKINRAFLIPPIIATGVVTFFEIRNCKKRNYQKLLMQDMVNIFKKINYLNSSIKKYVKTRIDIENKSQNNLFTGYTKQIDIFFRDTLSSEKLFFETMIKNIGIIVDFSDVLIDDFNSIKHFQPLTELNQIENLQTGLDFLNKAQDIHVWLTSKLFNYLSIMFFCPTEQLTDKVYERITNLQLRSLLNFLQQHYNITEKQFYALRNTEAKLVELKSIKPERHLSHKLHKTLLSAIDNLSIISEKSHIIISEIEKTDGPPSEMLEIAIIDLRNHTFAAFESIDLLCRLYGILTTQRVPSVDNKIPKVEQQSQDSTLANYHHDDLVNVPEENFELYLEKDHDNATHETNSYQEDNSGAYLSLLLKELKQSLGTHERFIDARKRRGSIDANIVAGKNEIEIPSFNLSALKPDEAVKIPDDSELDHTNNETLNISSHVSSCPPPPPPPPPLPKDDNMFNVEALSIGELYPKSMIDGIQTLSSQLKMEEEVFGESTDETEEKN